MAPISLVIAQAEAARAPGLGVAFFDFETVWQRSNEPVTQRQEARGLLLVEPAMRQRSEAVTPQSPAICQLADGALSVTGLLVVEA